MFVFVRLSCFTYDYRNESNTLECEEDATSAILTIRKAVIITGLCFTL